MTYVSDPQLISILNSKAGMGSGIPVNDPDLINQLNKKAGIADNTSSIPNLISQISKNNSVNSTDNNMNNIIPSYAQEDLKKLAGYGTMLAAPEIKLGSILPSTIRSILPKLSGASKVAADYLSGVAKTGAAGYGGSKIMGQNENDSINTGLAGAGITAASTPFSMMTSSLNPYTRLAAGAGLGSLIGYGTGQLTGAGIGGVTGALLGLKGRGATELAAQHVADAVTPEQQALASARQKAAGKIGVPLTAAEATGSPILGAMQQEAAGSSGGSKVLYPFGLNRQQAEENSYNNLLNIISPENTKNTLESSAFKKAFSDKSKVNIDPVIDYINKELPRHEEGSKIALALKQAKSRLNITPQTQQKYAEIMAPLAEIENKLKQERESIYNQLQSIKQNVPNSYFRASTGYDQKLSSLQHQLVQHDSMLKQFSDNKDQFIKQNNIGNYENSVEGLHNAKMGIQGLIEGQGDQAIGNTAAGKLKQVNKILTNQIKEASTEYAEATKISNLRQAREGIEDAMKKSSLTGSNFYDKILSNRTEYNNLYKRLGNAEKPNIQTEPQKNLAAMRLALPDLINNLSAKSGQALATSHPELGSSFSGLAKSFINKIYMDRYNKAIAELMINPRWQDELRSVSRMKSGEDRGVQLGKLISKVATIGLAAQNNQQGRAQYGSEQ